MIMLDASVTLPAETYGSVANSNDGPGDGNPSGETQTVMNERHAKGEGKWDLCGSDNTLSISRGHFRTL